jgi:hypothetical protein
VERELSSLSDSLLARRRKGSPPAVPAVTEADTVEKAAVDADNFPTQLLFAAAAGISCSLPAAAAGMQEVLWGDEADFLDPIISTAAKLSEFFSSHPWPPFRMADGSSWIFLDFLLFSFWSAETLLKTKFPSLKHEA